MSRHIIETIQIPFWPLSRGVVGWLGDFCVTQLSNKKTFRVHDMKCERWNVISCGVCFLNVCYDARHVRMLHPIPIPVVGCKSLQKSLPEMAQVEMNNKNQFWPWVAGCAILQGIIAFKQSPFSRCRQTTWRKYIDLLRSSRPADQNVLLKIQEAASIL